jgi:hypothetical protein
MKLRITMAPEPIAHPLGDRFIKRAGLARKGAVQGVVVLERVSCVGNLDKFRSSGRISIHNLGKQPKVAIAHAKSIVLMSAISDPSDWV